MFSLIKFIVKKLDVEDKQIREFVYKKQHRNAIVYRFLLETSVEITISCLIATFFIVENF